MSTKLTPVIVVSDIQASLRFYRDQLGFTVDMLEPKDAPSFASLKSGAAEIMLQTVEAMSEDIPDAVVPSAARGSIGFSGVLYHEVEDFDAVTARIPADAVITRERKAPYGMTETIVRDPSGYVVVIAQPTVVGEKAKETAAVG
ncbi:MAG TPA: VOC family protein [Candidatus Dormibacteraeota bacterium]|nr:VOC family protein [Candidatus Dormibacteraeota bacterium]